jgi:transcription elongation regulator 1
LLTNFYFGFLAYREKVVDTHWVIVFTKFEQPYYFHLETKETTWDIPEELLPEDQRQQDEDSMSADGASGSVEGSDGEGDDEQGSVEGNDEDGPVDSKKRDRPADADALEPDAKRQKQDEEEDDAMDAIPIPLLDEEGDEQDEQQRPPSVDATEELRKRAYEEQLKVAELRYEEKLNQFKQMLREKGVGPTDSWGKVQPLLVSDPRFNCTQSIFLFVFDDGI